MRLPLFHLNGRRGFTLPELVVATAILVVGGAIVYPMFVGNFGLYARTFSINKSNNSLRTSLQQLKQDLDMSVEPPTLASFRMNNGVGVLKPLADSTVSAQAFLTWVNLGPSYLMSPTTTGGTTVDTTKAIKITRHARDTTDGSEESPFPQVGDRLVILSPGPYSTGMGDTVSMDGASIQKPGRLITSVTTTGGGAINGKDTSSTDFLIKIDQGSPKLSLVTISAPQSVIIIRERAYVAYTINNAAGTPVERQLLYYPNTYAMDSPQVLIRDLDPSPKEIDSNTSAAVQPFNYYGDGKGTLSALNVILPIRALDYANAIAERNLGAAASGTSPSEFNVYLRSNTTMRIKARLMN